MGVRMFAGRGSRGGASSGRKEWPWGERRAGGPCDVQEGWTVGPLVGLQDGGPGAIRGMFTAHRPSQPWLPGEAGGRASGSGGRQERRFQNLFCTPLGACPQWLRVSTTAWLPAASGAAEAPPGPTSLLAVLCPLTPTVPTPSTPSSVTPFGSISSFLPGPGL